MDKPPMEWIDKLFDCMATFYKERWTDRYRKATITAIYKAMWQSALYGCTHDEIRNVLLHFRKMAGNGFHRPPNQVGFHWEILKRRGLCK